MTLTPASRQYRGARLWMRGAATLIGLLVCQLQTLAERPDADYATHVRQLRERVPSAAFSIVVEKPFVVVGDCDAAVLRQTWAEGTIRWAVKQLKATYFSQDPKHIIDIWLFKNAKSYTTHAKALWGTAPDTPYGYYSAHNRVLVMNIATGGGTLVHEIVHPFVEANFPACPAWFNEGLGSLYEQCCEQDGQISGLTNWRLAGLKKTIRKGKTIPFKTLFAMDDETFYSGRHGDVYAPSRYLLYYLQQKGLLRRYYTSFLAKQASDPSGYETLKDILGEADMVAFQKTWEAYVLKLTFP